MKYTYTKERRDPQIQSYMSASGKRWRIKFAITKGGRKLKVEKQGFTSFDAARSAKLQEINAIENGNTLSNITVREYFENYCEEKMANGSWRYPSYIRISKMFENHLYSHWGNVKLQDVTRSDYQRWLTKYIKTKNFSITTARSLNYNIASVFTEAVLDDVIMKNPIQKIKVFGNSPRDTSMTRKEFDKVLNFIRTTDLLSTQERAMAYLTLLGLRHEEIDGIKLKYVKDNLIGVFEVLNAHGQVTEPKTQSSKRWIPMPPFVEEQVQQSIHLSRQVYAKHNRIMSKDDFIFVNSLGKHISYNDLSLIFKTISRETGVHVWPHKMRHAFSTIAFGIEGLNPRDIANILGHSKIDMSLYYNNGTEEGKVSAMKKIGKLL